MTTAVFPNKLARLLVLGLILAPALATAQFATVQFTESAVTVDETAGTATVTVGIDGPGNNGGVGFHTVPGTADATDYQPMSGFLFWEGQDSSPKDIVVPIVDDGVPEGDEAFTVELTSGDGVIVGSSSVVTVTITEGGGESTETSSTPRHRARRRVARGTLRRCHRRP